jgi:hypothetical protein
MIAEVMERLSPKIQSILQDGKIECKRTDS